MKMHSANIHRSAGHWPKENACGSLTLDFDARHRRRIRLRADEGEEVLLDLPNAVAMADGDGLQLDDGRWLRIQAAAEPVVEIRHQDPGNSFALHGTWETGIYQLKFRTRFFAFDQTT